MKSFLLFIIVSLFVSCDPEDRWKRETLEGRLTDRASSIDFPISVDLNSKSIVLNKSSYIYNQTIEQRNAIYGRVVESHFPIPAYFKIQKESLTRFQIQFFHDKPNPQMIFGELFLNFDK